jgi:two-component system sensor histidine kinase BarA
MSTSAISSAKSSSVAPASSPHPVDERSIENRGSRSTRLAECLAALGHDIRTPLNVILGYVGLLSDALSAKTDHGHRRLLDGIERGAKRLRHTVEAALDFASIEVGEFKPKPDRVDLTGMAQEVIAEFEPVATEKGLTLSCNIEVAECVVQFDQRCLSRAISCLLDNAVKFTRQGSVAVRIFRDARDELCFEIRDTGAGIDAAKLASLFKIPTPESAVGRGRAEEGGLGLKLTGRYLSLNGARLLVASQKGRGSVFTIVFARESELS